MRLTELDNRKGTKTTFFCHCLFACLVSSTKNHRSWWRTIAVIKTMRAELTSWGLLFRLLYELPASKVPTLHWDFMIVVRMCIDHAYSPPFQPQVHIHHGITGSTPCAGYHMDCIPILCENLLIVAEDAVRTLIILWCYAHLISYSVLYLQVHTYSTCLHILPFYCNLMECCSRPYVCKQ